MHVKNGSKDLQNTHKSAAELGTPYHADTSPGRSQATRSAAQTGTGRRLQSGLDMSPATAVELIGRVTEVIGTAALLSTAAGVVDITSVHFDGSSFSAVAARHAVDHALPTVTGA